MDTASPIHGLMRHRALLQVEYCCEKEEFRRQTEAIGIQRKVKRGDAWFPVAVGRSYYNSLNQTAIEITRTGNTGMEHNLEPGRPVCFFTIDESPKPAGKAIEYFATEATVSYADGDRLVVIPDTSRLADELRMAQKPVGVQLAFDETSYRLMFEALDKVIGAKTGRLAALRDLFASGTRPARRNIAPMALPWLNPSQEHAVNEILAAKDVAIVHGPPGTGKTTTLVEAIYETLRRESQVLVCAQSNMAVDWIAEKMVDRGISVMRIGNPTRVNDKMLSFTYERMFEAHPDYPQLWSIRKAIRELRQQRRHGESGRQRIEKLRARATEIEVRIDTELFDRAKVIASTLTGTASRLLDGHRFASLFIDEAAQALEAACWIAMGRADRVVLAGDHCQLPPTVKSIAALKGGLSRTLMERLAEQKPEAVTMLDMQYRMNEKIMSFPAGWFYGGHILTAPQVGNRSILELDSPMTWVDTSGLDGKEEFVGQSFGRINKTEAEATIDTLEQYLAHIGKKRIDDEHIDVGIITPYRAQVEYLRTLTRKSTALQPYRHQLTVNTVDGFQGQERDVIIISLVRSNDKGEIGFLSDLRRMNVAITRARMKLIIIGDTATMTKHTFYKKLYEHIGKEGKVISYRKKEERKQTC